VVPSGKSVGSSTTIRPLDTLARMDMVTTVASGHRGSWKSGEATMGGAVARDRVAEPRILLPESTRPGCVSAIGPGRRTRDRARAERRSSCRAAARLRRWRQGTLPHRGSRRRSRRESPPRGARCERFGAPRLPVASEVVQPRAAAHGAGSRRVHIASSPVRILLARAVLPRIIE
jgi:hypothetical protein